jgi:hypothetical protein
MKDVQIIFMTEEKRQGRKGGRKEKERGKGEEERREGKDKVEKLCIAPSFYD